ncbi:MAG TPA: PPOX class F420-dependent oxidoreductase [Ktedonobacterales bacterium]
MKSQQIQDQAGEAFAALPTKGVALLTTFRRSGEAVPTPVEIRVRGERVYFTTWSTTGKVKRLAHTPGVTLARCTRFGKPTSPRVAGVARRLDVSEAEAVSAYFGKGPWARLWNQIYRLRGWQPVIYEVSPANTSVQS